MFSLLFSLSVLKLDPSRTWVGKHLELLFSYRYYGSNNFRIPAIIYAKDESIIGISDIRYNHAGDLPAKIGVAIRRKPKGKPWESAFLASGTIRDVGDGDAAAVMDRKTGVIYLVWSGDRGYQGGSMSSPDNPAHVYFTRSYDNGVNWDDKIDITHFIFSKLCTQCSEERKSKWIALFVSSGAGCQMRDGRLTFACLVLVEYDEGKRHDCNYILYTDDFGETWDMEPGAAMSGGANEAKLIELNNGTLMISIRQMSNRRFVYSNDRGKTWYGGWNHPQVKDGWCNGEIKRMTSVIDGFNKNRILSSTTFRGGYGWRSNVSLAISYDEGLTFPYARIIENLDSAYSTIDTTKDGEILVHYEKNGPSAYDMTVATVSLEWLTEGTDHFERAKLLQWCLSSTESSKCPKDTYRFNYKVFDQYVESYSLVYPEEIRYTFVEKFRDFIINLNAEGLHKGTYNNLNDKMAVNIIGKSELERSLSFNNFDVTIQQKQLMNAAVFVENGQLTIRDVGGLIVYFGQKELQFFDSGVKKSFPMTSTTQVIIEVVGDIEVHPMPAEPESGPELNPTTNLLSNGFSLTIKTNAKNVTIKFKGTWEKDTAELIHFDVDNSTTIFVQEGNEDLFPDAIPEPLATATPAQTPPPSASILPAPSTVPPKGPAKILISYAIAMLFGGLAVGLTIGFVIVFFRYRRKENTVDASEKGVVFQSFNDTI
ncbi:hypothetical protein TRFO_22652 [Tritrichomonas foetus]|uniref:Sialidase domain-containing protein n=1 Tax=Tritrichomonas foetus TaxID=1144522 RepID=A0A1J4KC44_9EUKA|nr:hypothetical protein TRFO_22652 [Tritrichomonas foetus]|eukprot:OHT08795.1 hypothetical protein TRFO_22652 [Tritrichomonas foetus]